MSSPIANTKGPLSEAIFKDHREIFQYYDMYNKSAGDTDAQTRWSNQLMWEVARHSVGEEIVVYPLFEKHLGAKGAEMANHDREEHQVVKDNLKKLESMKVGSQEFNSLLKETMNALQTHIDTEEAHDFPMLEPEIGQDGSAKSAKSFDMTKKFVPTRSHPSAPNTPPMETLAGFLATPLDKLKDMFSKFPTQEMKRDANDHQSDVRV